MVVGKPLKHTFFSLFAVRENRAIAPAYFECRAGASSSVEDGWEAMTVVDSRGFGENALVRGKPLNNPAAVRTLDKEELAQIQESDPLAMEGAPDMVKFMRSIGFEVSAHHETPYWGESTLAWDARACSGHTKTK